MTDRPTIIHGKYRVGKRIEKQLNTIAETRSGVDTTNGEEVEITIFTGRNKSDTEGRQHIETHFNNHLKLSNYNKPGGRTNEGIATVYYFGDYTDKSSHVLVSEKLGQNLHKYFDSTRKTLRIETIADIAVKLINICQTVHKNNLLIRYISPEAFSLDKRNTLTKLFLTDFHMCKSFTNKPANKHPIRPVGNARYASISVGLGNEYARRDDLEAIGYILVYFAKRGSLPWMGMAHSGTNKQIFERISRAKLFTPIELLCEGLDKSFAHFIRSVRTLEFEEQPDYHALRQGFAELANHTHNTPAINKENA